MSFSEFLESRFGTALGYALMCAVGGAVAFPFVFMKLIRYHTSEVLLDMTGHVFWCSELEVAVFCAGLGFIRGTRFGPLPASAMGFGLGLLLAALAVALDLQAYYFPEGAPIWIAALLISVGGLSGLILGLQRVQDSQMDKDLSLQQIRAKSRRR